MEQKEEYYTTNNVASIIKMVAIVSLIIEILVCIANSNDLGAFTFIVIVISFISSVFVYAIGELIEIIHDIRTNSEHIRDYLEGKK